MQPEPDRHISYSQISTYMNCPLRYRYRYIDGARPDHISADMLLGRVVHQALEQFYRRRRDQYSTMALPEMQHLFENYFRQAFESESEIPVRFSKSHPDSADLLQTGTALLSVFHENVGPRPPLVIEVEKPLQAYLPVGNGITLAGVVDLIELGEDDNYVLVDNKTAARRKSQDDVCEDLQLSAYSYLLAASAFVHHYETVNCRIDALVKTKTATFERYHTRRTPGCRARFLRIVDQIVRAIDNQIFYPNRSWMCAGCGYTSLCAQWHHVAMPTLGYSLSDPRKINIDTDCEIEEVA